MKGSMVLLITMAILALVVVLFLTGVFSSGPVLEPESEMPWLSSYVRDGEDLHKTRKTFPEPVVGDRFEYSGYVYTLEYNGTRMYWYAKKIEGNIFAFLSSPLEEICGIKVYESYAYSTWLKSEVCATIRQV